MDDTAVRRYFTQPTHIFHRRYEALRAVLVEGRSQKKVAGELAFQYHSLRQLMWEFRHSFDAGQACPSVRTFFTQQHEQQVFCHANASLTRDEQSQEVLRFVDY